MLPLYIVGQSSLKAIDLAISLALAQWCDVWCLTKPHLSVSSHRFDSASMVLDPCAIGVQYPNGECAWLGVTDKDLNRAIYGKLASACPSDDLAAQVQLRCQQDLLNKVLAEFGVSEPTVVSAAVLPTLTELKSPHGYVLVLINIADVQLSLLLNPLLVAHLITPMVSSNSAALNSRQGAIQDVQCTATITLELGEWPLSTLQTLSVGDTLHADISLSKPFAMNIGPNLSFPVFLGRTGEYKAVCLTTPKTM